MASRDVLDPVPSRVNGISVNRRAEGLIQGAMDIVGAGDLYRDIKLIGNLMSIAEQQATLGQLKGTLQSKLGMMRVLPSPSDLGAMQVIDSSGTRYDHADLIDRYSDAIRKVELMKAGVIELNTRNMMITSIGTERMAPDAWVAENTRRYEQAFTSGVETGQKLYDARRLHYPADMPRQLQVGMFADAAARTAVIDYNKRIGVPEGAGQLLSMNRWTYDPSGSGQYNRVDLLMDLGPNRDNGALLLRTAIEGKASLDAVRSSGTQLQRVSDWITPRVITVTPQGATPYTPVRRIR